MEAINKSTKEDLDTTKSDSDTTLGRNLMGAFTENGKEGPGRRSADEMEVVSYLDEPISNYHYLPTKYREKWCSAALRLSVISIFISLVFSMSSFLVSKHTDSSSVFASAFDALLGVLSSAAVAWRFRDFHNGEIGSTREKIATMGIAVSFIATGIATTTTSIIHLIDQTHPKKTNEMLIILTCSLVTFLLLAYAQNCISKRLDSSSLRAAAVDYGLASAMAFGILISTYIYREYRPRLWWLDHVVALFLGIISAAYGLHLVLIATFCNSAILGEKKPLTE